MKFKTLVTLATVICTTSVFATCPTIQSGHGTISSGHFNAQINLPCAYPDTNYSVSVSGISPGFAFKNKSNTGFEVNVYDEASNQNYSFDWIAVQN